MRSRTGRELAERALARLALELGDRVTSLTVIGGLNADLLTLPQEAAHQGTVDIDVLVEIGFVFDREEQDLGWVERGLVRASFSPLSDEGWRWETRVETAAVVVDLLCDVPDNHGREIPLPGRPRAGAMNLAGPGAGLMNGVVRTLTSEDGRLVDVRFAGLGGYLLAKASAVHHRGADKDLYDLGFVIIHNLEGGPIPAARAAHQALSPHQFVDHPRTFLASLRLLSAEERGARVYAEQRIRDGEDQDVETLVQDVVGAALACGAEFGRLITHSDDATGHHA